MLLAHGCLGNGNVTGHSCAIVFARAKCSVENSSSKLLLGINRQKTGTFCFSLQRAKNGKKKNFSRRKKQLLLSLSTYSTFMSPGLYFNKIIHHEAQETS